MDPARLTGILLIAAFAATMLSGFATPSGLYQTQDVEERLRIIEDNRSRWMAERVLVLAGLLLLTVGFWQFAVSLQLADQAWIPRLGQVAILAGSIAGLYFIYLQTSDPLGGYSGAYPLPEQLAYWLWLAGQLLIGIAILQAGLPAWLGYLTAGLSVAYSIVFLLTGAGFMTPFLLALVGLLIGIVLLRA